MEGAAAADGNVLKKLQQVLKWEEAQKRNFDGELATQKRNLDGELEALRGKVEGLEKAVNYPAVHLKM